MSAERRGTDPSETDTAAPAPDEDAGPDEDEETDGTGGTDRANSPENPEPAQEADPRAHLGDVKDGCGCAEVWAHLSEQRGE